MNEDLEKEFRIHGASTFSNIIKSCMEKYCVSILDKPQNCEVYLALVNLAEEMREAILFSSIDELSIELPLMSEQFERLTKRIT